MRVPLDDGSFADIDLAGFYKWQEDFYKGKVEEREKERKKRARPQVLKEPKKLKDRGQMSRRVCQNNNSHIFDVPAHKIDDHCPICGGRMKLQAE